MAASAAAAEAGPERTVGLLELAPHLVCPLCSGYFIDATAIVECLHAFCRSCILRHLRRTRRCPVAGCDVLVQKAQGASAASLRPDAILQSIVYKTVPGLHRDEMRRRQLFYADKPDSAADVPPGAKGLKEDGGAYFYDANDTIDIRIQYAPQRPEDVVPLRYLRCPAGLPLSALRKFLHRKYQLSETLRMELLHDDRRLPSEVKLLDVAYMVNWDREAPLELLFRMHKQKSAVKRSADVLLQESSPAKVSKLDGTDASASIDQASKKEKSSSQQVRAKPAKAVPEVVSDSNRKRHDEKADMKRKVSNGSTDAGISTKPVDCHGRKKSGSTSVMSNQKSKSGSANMASPVLDKAKEVKPLPTVSIERIDEKRTTKAIETTQKDKVKDSVPAPKSSKVSKTALPTSVQKRKPSVKPQTNPSASLQRGGSIPMLAAEDVSPSGKVEMRSGPAVDLSAKQSGCKAKTVTNDPGQPAEKRKNHSAVRSSSEHVGHKPKMPAKQTDVSSQDTNTNKLKHLEKVHHQDSEKQVSKHQDQGTKEEPEKGTNSSKAIQKQETHKKKANDAHMKQAFSQKPCNKDERRSGTTFKSLPVPAHRPSPAEGNANGSMPAVPLQSVKARQAQGKSPKTASHGTNTFLSSSPQITKAQTSSSSSSAQKMSQPTATSLYSSHGKSPRAELSERCSPIVPKTSALDGKNSASKTIFLFSGSNKPQNSNKIMSIVESLTQKSLLSSLAKKASLVPSMNQPAEQRDAANGTPRSSKSPTAVSKTPSVSTNGTFVAPNAVPAKSTAAPPVRPVSSPLHIETASLGLRYVSAVPPLSGLPRPAPSSTPTTTSSRPVFPVPPLPQRPKSQSVRSIPNPSLVRQRSAEERARDCGKGSPTAGSTAPAMSPPTIRDINNLTRQLQEAGTSVTITNTTC